MKRKIFSLFIAVQLAMGIMLTGCSGEKKNVAESKESVSQEKDEYFVWFLAPIFHMSFSFWNH